jgi:hypothetical protein
VDEHDDLVATVDQPIHVRLHLVPATDPVAEVRADGGVPLVGPGAWNIRGCLPDELLCESLGREAMLREGTVDLLHEDEVRLRHGACATLATLNSVLG